MLTKYGTDNIIIGLIIGLGLIILSYFLGLKWYSYLICIFGIIIFLFTLWFFRDPVREIPYEAKIDHKIVISPADGKVIEIKEINENKFLFGKAVQISIFLSPLDVHVNRVPVTGKVLFYKYIPGKYLVAYHPKSSELNEHSLIGVQTEYGKVLFKQIVGIIARRLVCTIKEGDMVHTGEQFGMMKFGSRMDVIVNPNSEILVHEGDKVIGGITYLAKLKLNQD